MIFGVPLRSLFEFLEPYGQPVPIWTILAPPPQLDHLPGDPFSPSSRKRTIVDFEQTLTDVDAEIRVDAD